MKSDKPAVLFAIQKSGFRSDLSWGPAILVRAICSGLHRSGFPVTQMTVAGQRIFLREEAGHPTQPVPFPQTWTGNRIYRWFESAVRGVQSRLGLPYLGLFDNLRSFEACLKLLDRFGLCHEYYTLFGIGALLACRLRKVPHILLVDADLILETELAGVPLRGLQKAYAVALARYLFRHTTRMICVSEAARTHFVQDWDVPPAKIAVLPNGVEERFFAAGEPDRANGGKPQRGEAAVIVFVGSFQPWHGLDLILDSFSKVRLECPGTTLLLIGDGPVRRAVEKKVERLGLNGSVRFAGQQPHASIPGWLQSADIAIAPYLRQTDELWFSPLKLYEYMAAGKAVVATDSGQIAQVIESGVTGILVEPNDAEALAAALIDLVNDPEKRDLLGRNASRKARSEHTWGVVIRNLEQIYQGLNKNDENI